MKHFTSFAALALAAVAGAWSFTPALAQAPAAKPPAGIAKPWTMPRTPDGKPDLQGNWTNVTITPLERPQGVTAKVMTEAEARKLESAVTERVEKLAQPSDPNRPAPPQGGDGSTGAAGNVGGYNNFWIDSGDKVIRYNGELRTSIIVEPANGRIPPTLPEYQAAQKARLANRPRFGQYDNPENRPAAERCIVSFGSNMGPPMLPNGFYNNNYTIVQTKDHIMFHTEMVHDTRIVRMNTTERLPKHLRPYFGDSIGRWEGDTLVVETTNFHPSLTFRGGSENMKITEWFTRIDADTINYKFKVEDPTVWATPFVGELPFEKLDDLIYEYACHEGNYALANVLSGARAQEREEAKKKSQQQQ